MSLQPNEPASNAGVKLGERLRDRGLSIAEKRHKAQVRKGGRTVVKLTLAGQRVTADDVHDELRLSDDIHHKWIGSIFRSLSLARAIKRAGAEPSRRPENHARWQTIWVLCERSAAEQWLADHPELPEPAAPTLFDGLDDRGAA